MDDLKVTANKCNIGDCWSAAMSMHSDEVLIRSMIKSQLNMNEWMIYRLFS
jgi:hypothetical protein